MLPVIFEEDRLAAVVLDDSSSEFLPSPGIPSDLGTQPLARFSGTGFCNGNAAVGAYAQFTVNAPAAGTTTLAIRFANGASSTADRPATLIVSGAIKITVSFESTGTWTAWTTKTVTVAVNAGNNTIRLDPTTAAGLPNIDYLETTA